jgi:choline-glycine betaine transporter
MSGRLAFAIAWRRGFATAMLALIALSLLVLGGGIADSARMRMICGSLPFGFVVVLSFLSLWDQA